MHKTILIGVALLLTQVPVLRAADARRSFATPEAAVTALGDALKTTNTSSFRLLFDTAWAAARDQLDEEYVTGNNDADGPYLLQ